MTLLSNRTGDRERLNPSTESSAAPAPSRRAIAVGLTLGLLCTPADVALLSYRTGHPFLDVAQRYMELVAVGDTAAIIRPVILAAAGVFASGVCSVAAQVTARS